MKNNKLSLILLGVLFAGTANSSVYVFGGLGASFGWYKPKIKSKVPSKEDIVKKIGEMSAPDLSALHTKANGETDGDPETLTDAVMIVESSAFGINLMEKVSGDMKEDIQNTSLNLELGVIGLYPINDDIEVGAMVGIEYGFGSFSGSAKNLDDMLDKSNSDNKDSKKTDKLPECVTFSDGFVFKIGPAVKLYSVILAGGLRFANRKISIDNKKFDELFSKYSDFITKSSDSDSKNNNNNNNNNSDKEALVMGWFLQAMYLFELSESCNVYVKAGLGGDCGEVKMDKKLETVFGDVNFEVENKKAFNIDIGVGFAYKF